MPCLVNSMTVVHASSNGTSPCFPDTCKMSTPAGPVPVPLPNIAMSSDTAKETKQVKVEDKGVCVQDSNFSTSSGDEAGSIGGVVSSKTKGKAEFVNYSFDVKIEGKNVCRLGDMMVQNKGGSPNTPPMPEVQPPLVMVPVPEQDPKPVKLTSAKISTKAQHEA